MSFAAALPFKAGAFSFWSKSPNVTATASDVSVNSDEAAFMFCDSDNTIPLSKVLETPTLIVLAKDVSPLSSISNSVEPDSVKSVALALTARAVTPTVVNKILRMRIPLY